MTDDAKSDRPRRGGSRGALVALAGAIALFGLALRLCGLRLGLPYLHHWDECWVIWSAESMLRHGDDVPTSYQYGAPMSLLVVEGFRLSRHIVAGLRADDVTLRWIGRLVGAFVTSSGALALFFASRESDPREERGARAGVFAALLYACASELVTHGRYAVTDGVLAAGVAWTLCFAALYWRRRRLAWAVAVIAAAGLTFAFKVSALPLLIVPPLVLVLAPPPRGGRRALLAHRALLLAAIPAMVTCYFALNPHVVDRYEAAIHDLVGRSRQTREGGFPSYLLRTPGLPHLRAVLGDLFTLVLARSRLVSLPIAAVALAGLVTARRSARTIPMIALVHAGAAILFMALPNRAYLVRNYLVAVPALCLGFGLGAAALSGFVGERYGRSISRIVAASLTLLVAAPALANALANQRLSEDSRMRALDWIDAHAGDAVVSVAVTPTLTGKPGLGIPSDVERHLAREKIRYVKPVSSAAEAAASGADYVVTASYRGSEQIISPYDDRFLFREAAGYHTAASFEANPYEHNFEVTPSWDGRVTTLVLARDR